MNRAAILALWPSWGEGLPSLTAALQQWPCLAAFPRPVGGLCVTLGILVCECLLLKVGQVTRIRPGQGWQGKPSLVDIVWRSLLFASWCGSAFS